MLSKRLNKIIEWVKPDKSLADIGSDHGLVPANLLDSGKINSAIITDINEKPLIKATLFLKEKNLLDNAVFRLGNGLEPLNKNEVDQVVIAGMGGDTIATILEKDLDKAHSFDYYILQPMTRDEKLRQSLINNNFEIIKEIVVKEETAKKDRFFKILLVSNGQNKVLDSNEIYFGQEEKIEYNSDYLDYLEYELDQYKNKISKMNYSSNEKTLERRKDFERRFNFLKKRYESLKNNPIN